MGLLPNRGCGERSKHIIKTFYALDAFFCCKSILMQVNRSSRS
jgi:hypothetical protein